MFLKSFWAFQCSLSTGLRCIKTRACCLWTTWLSSQWAYSAACDSNNHFQHVWVSTSPKLLLSTCKCLSSVCRWRGEQITATQTETYRGATCSFSSVGVFFFNRWILESVQKWMYWSETPMDGIHLTETYMNIRSQINNIRGSDGLMKSLTLSRLLKLSRILTFIPPNTDLTIT